MAVTLWVSGDQDIARCIFNPTEFMAFLFNPWLPRQRYLQDFYRVYRSLTTHTAFLGDGDDTRDFGEGRNAWGRIHSYRVHGEDGNDRISFSSDTNNRVWAGSGDDTVYGGAGVDRLEGGHGDDQLFGRDGNDYLIGDGGDDVLDGGNGNDILTGRDGADTLVGGSGADHFHVGHDDSLDYVSDFRDRGDRVTVRDFGRFDITRNRQFVRVFDVDDNMIAQLNTRRESVDIAMTSRRGVATFTIVDDDNGGLPDVV